MRGFVVDGSKIFKYYINLLVYNKMIGQQNQVIVSVMK